MADIRIKDLTTTASSTASDDFFAADGTTNGTRKLSAYSPTFGGNATVSGTLTVNGASIATAGQISSTATSALLAAQVYIANGASSGTNGALSGSQFYAQPGYSLFVGTTGNGTAASYQGGVLSGVVQDQQNYIIGDGARGLLLHAVNGVLRFATGNTGVQRGYFDASGLKVEPTTASTSYNSGALVVSGGVGIAGALYSQQNTNGILAGAYFENASTGNAATIRHRLTAGASTCDIEAYGSGHATLANRLRFGTSNGQIDFVPSGVLGLSISANDVTVASGVGLRVGNAYTAGAPTATGYIVIKDSTGTSYKIPAVAL